MQVLPDPVPRDVPLRYESIHWPVGERVQLPPRTAPLEIDFVPLMEQRQTRRSFGRQMDDRALGEFLWLACRSRWSRPSVYGPNQESRPHPSTGALHPIHVLVGRDCTALHHYEPTEHALIEIPGSTSTATLVIEAAKSSLELGHGLVLALVAEPGKTSAKYEHPETLVWRDAGVVLGYMSIIAESLGLAFCPLGITGHPFVTQVLPTPNDLVGTGLAVLGIE